MFKQLRIQTGNRKWEILLLSLFLVGVILLSLLLTYNPVAASENLPISIASNRLADYSPDILSTPLPALELSIIKELLRDQNPTNLPLQIAEINSAFLTPIPTRTPQATDTPVNTPLPGTPSSTPSATSEFTPTETSSISLFASNTPTNTPDPLVSSTPTPTVLIPTSVFPTLTPSATSVFASPTLLPSSTSTSTSVFTSTPSQTPTATLKVPPGKQTQTAQAPTPTATFTATPTSTPAPSNTPVPTSTTIPSNTPAPSNTPVPTKTVTSTNTPTSTATTSICSNPDPITGYLLDSTPMDGATGVSRTVIFEVVFNQPMDEGTLTKSIKFSDKKIKMSYDYDPLSNTLTITFNKTLKSFQSYTLTLTRNIKNSCGTRQLLDVDINFRTGVIID